MGPQGLEEGQLNNYVTVQPIIHISDDNRTAKARWRSDVKLSRGGKGRWGGGVYENEYVNDKGTWKFSKLHLLRDLLGRLRRGLGGEADLDGADEHDSAAGQATDRRLPVLPEAAGGAVPLSRTRSAASRTRGSEVMLNQMSSARGASPLLPCCRGALRSRRVGCLGVRAYRC